MRTGRESQSSAEIKIKSQILEKVFQKDLKKDLTNERKCGIINKSSARRTLLKNGTAS